MGTSIAKRKFKLSGSTKRRIGWIVSAASVLGFFVGFYMLLISPTRKDIRRIENLVRASISQKQPSIPVLIPEGNKKLNDSDLEKLEKDIKNVESSIFFSLSGETYLDIAKFYFDQAKFKKALEYVDKSIRKTPLSSKALLLRSVLRFYAGSYQDALSDTDIVIGKSQDDKAKASALLVKGFVSYLTGDAQTSKDSLFKAAAFFNKTGESKEVLVICDYLMAEACFNLGEYDTGDYFYSSVRDVAKQLEKLEQKDSITTIILALVNLEGNLKTIVDNYARLLAINDETVLRDLVLYLYKMAASINDSEAFLTNVENTIQFCNKYEIVYLEQFFKELLFESWLDAKSSFRKDLWQEIISSPAKILATEADMYSAAGEFYQGQKNYETALDFFSIALERYKILNNKKGIIDAKINIYIIEFRLKNYFNSYKMLRSADEDINRLLKQSIKISYLYKRANEEIGLLRLHRDNIEELMPIIEKFLK